MLWRFKQYRLHEDWEALVDMATIAHYYNTQGWFKNFPTNFIKHAKECPKDKQSINWLFDSLYRHHAQTHDNKCNRWGDKTPANVNLLWPINQIFPDAKFIHMLRDGVDVALSWKKHGYYGNDIVKPAKRWVEAIKSVENFRTKHSDHLIEVRYENLVENPYKETKTINNFLNISFEKKVFNIEKSSVTGDLEKHDHYKNALQPVTDRYIGKGRQILSKKEKKELQPILNSMLEKYAYKPL